MIFHHNESAHLFKIIFGCPGGEILFGIGVCVHIFSNMRIEMAAL
jgi:hypothetical protein